MTTYVILKNGERKLVAPGRVLTDGTLRLTDRQVPVVLAAECAKLGLDPKKVQSDAAPKECLARPGMNAGGVEVISEEDFYSRQTAKRAAAVDALEKAIPGLTEMRDLESKVSGESERYHRQFKDMMEDEYNDGVNPPRPVNPSFAEKLSFLRKSNPRAALYLRAEHQARGTSSYSATSGAMKGGQDAMEILRSGGLLEVATAALAFRYPDTTD